MFYVLLDDRDRRNDVLELMRKTGVQATFHYQPLHASDAGRAFAVRETECPVSRDISGRLLRLPFYNNLDRSRPRPRRRRRSSTPRRRPRQR